MQEFQAPPQGPDSLASKNSFYLRWLRSGSLLVLLGIPGLGLLIMGLLTLSVVRHVRYRTHATYEACVGLYSPTLCLAKELHVGAPIPVRSLPFEDGMAVPVLAKRGHQIDFMRLRRVRLVSPTATQATLQEFVLYVDPNDPRNDGWLRGAPPTAIWTTLTGLVVKWQRTDWRALEKTP